MKYIKLYEDFKILNSVNTGINREALLERFKNPDQEFPAKVEDLTEIQVNLWDDYKRILEYDINDDTTLRVEEYELSPKDQKDITEYLLNWINDNIELEGIGFKIKDKNEVEVDGRMYSEITVSNLDSENFTKLNTILGSSKLKYKEIPFSFLSES